MKEKKEQANKHISILLAAGIYPPDPGGPATYARLIAEEFPKRRIETDVVLFRDVRHLPPIIRHIVYFVMVWRRARHADVIYVQDAVSVGLPSALAAFITEKPLVVRLGGIFSWEQGVQRFGVKDSLDEFVADVRRHNVRARLFVAIERFVCARAKRIIVPSEYLKDVLVRFGVMREKISVVYNTYDPIVGMGTKEEERHARGVTGFTVVSAGRFVPWKGFRGVIEAVARARKEIPDIQLVIVGDGPERAALESAAREAGILERVTFTGALPRAEALSYIRAADVFVLNTGYEGFAHFVLEAAALETPIITTDVPGNSEFLKDGVSALLVRHDDREGIADAIFKINKDSMLSARLANEAKKIPEQFSLNRLLRETETVFRSLMP